MMRCRHRLYACRPICENALLDLYTDIGRVPCIRHDERELWLRSREGTFFQCLPKQSILATYAVPFPRRPNLVFPRRPNRVFPRQSNFAFPSKSNPVPYLHVALKFRRSGWFTRGLLIALFGDAVVEHFTAYVTECFTECSTLFYTSVFHLCIAAFLRCNPGRVGHLAQVRLGLDRRGGTRRSPVETRLDLCR